MLRNFIATVFVSAVMISCNNNEAPVVKQEPAPKTYEERVKETESKIRNSPDWLQSVQKKAQEQNTALDSMIHKDAVWMVDEEDGKHKPGAQPDSTAK